MEEVAPDLSSLLIEPLTLVTAPGMKYVVLAQNPGLVESLDSAPGLIEALASNGVYENGGWRVLSRGTVVYQADRVVQRLPGDTGSYLKGSAKKITNLRAAPRPVNPVDSGFRRNDGSE